LAGLDFAPDGLAVHGRKDFYLARFQQALNRVSLCKLGICGKSLVGGSGRLKDRFVLL
jgi:hypothetical protein